MTDEAPRTPLPLAWLIPMMFGLILLCVGLVAALVALAKATPMPFEEAIRNWQFGLLMFIAVGIAFLEEIPAIKRLPKATRDALPLLCFLCLAALYVSLDVIVEDAGFWQNTGAVLLEMVANLVIFAGLWGALSLLKSGVSRVWTRMRHR